MQIQIITREKEYHNFIHTLYKEDEYFKDNKSGIFSAVCGRKSPFYKNSFQTMVAVKEKNNILCQGVFIIHKNYKDVMSIAFFEALENQQEAVNLFIEYAQEVGRKYGVKKIVVGLDGHCNHSVGFVSAIDKYPSFGENYQKEYYHQYFKDFAPVKFVSFYDDIKKVDEQVQKDLLFFQEKSTDISLEYGDFGKEFVKTMKRYTNLNNQIFREHRYYFTRQYDEDYDLFRSMRPLLKNENLIFATKEGKDIGFVLWYPDFNELVLKGKGAGIATFIKYRLLGRNPKGVKLVEMGVTHGQRNSGVILMLFAKAIEAAKKYKESDKVFSSWILDENKPSKNTTKRYTKKPYKEFLTYEKNI